MQFSWGQVARGGVHNFFLISGIYCTVPSVSDGTADPAVGGTGEYGTKYTITCDAGYEASGTDGDRSGACDDTGEFADPEPICTSKFDQLIVI